MTHTPPASTLLCESCGYDISGLPTNSACPECGRAIARSVPAHRTGSAWQRVRGPRSLIRSNFAALRHPRTIWQTVRIERSRSAQLLVLNILLGAACAAVLLMIRGGALPAVGFAYASSFFIGFAIVCLCLSAIEHVGIMFFGRRRGWRITPSVALTTVGHASVGWLIAGLLLGVMWHVGQHLPSVPRLPIPSRLRSMPGLTSWELMLPVFGFFIGLIVFETLVFLGFRALRYANAELNTPQAEANGRSE